MGTTGATIGSGVGAAAGSTLGPIGTIGGGMLGGAIGGLFDSDDSQAYLEEMRRRRAQQKQQQYDLLARKQAPQMSPQMEARLKALEQESIRGPLVTDPEFQGARARAVMGGRQALAGVQNRQGATGAMGGFQNIGSMQNVYDRLGGELAQLGEQQTAVKNQKAMQVAQARQSFTDATTAYNNAMIDAQMAIESGDAAMLNDSYARMYAAQQQQDQSKNAMMNGIIRAGIGQMSAGGDVGGVTPPAGGSDQSYGLYGGAQPTVGGASGLGGPNLFGNQPAQRTFGPAYQMRNY